MTVVSYTDSSFTRVHDLVSLDEKKDHRGTFSHMGVRMEGLESRRHLNFKFQKTEDATGGVMTRDISHKNVVILQVGESGGDTPTRALISKLSFDTAFYTKNNVRTIYSATFHDELTDKSVEVCANVRLTGDANKDVLIEPTHATKITLTMSEGGLCRFFAHGDTTVDQLPSKVNLLEGASVFGATDLSYGAPQLVLRNKREGNSMNGWETCRNSYRQRLGIATKQPITPKVILVDTYQHLLNNFQVFCVLGCNNTQGLTEEQLIESLPLWDVSGGNEQALVKDKELDVYIQKFEDEGFIKSYKLLTNELWSVVVPMTSLHPDRLHTFPIDMKGSVTHLMLFGLPDGGVHRVCLY
jgi:allantoicase